MTTPGRSPLKRWIDMALGVERLDAQSLIVTVFGDSIAPFGGHAWLKSLIALAGPFGISERLVRTSVFRLSADGWLAASRTGRRSAYRLTPGGQDRFEQAYRRVYSPAGPVAWDGRWTFVVLPSGEAALARAQLRRELEWEGFAPLGAGLLAHPAARLDAVGGILDRLGLRQQVFVLTGAEAAIPPTGWPAGLPAGLTYGRALADFARVAWSLDDIAASYALFMQRTEPLAGALRDAADVSPRDAFIARTLLIHFFRRRVLRDPHLPDALLPGEWPRHAAHALCARLYGALHVRASQHVRDTLEAESGSVPAIAPWFYQRFGGLPGA